MALSLQQFIREFITWLPNVVIVSKDEGMIKFKRLYNSQILLLRTIANLSQDQRKIVILKARQLGITTILDAIDLFYPMRYQGIRGAVMFARYEDRDRERAKISHQIYPYIPRKWRVGMLSNSREVIRFENGSELYFLYTSNRADNKGFAGRGNSFNYLHASEVAYFRSEEDYEAIQSALSDKHPLRLYIYESTANGYNLFYDLWESAKKGATSVALFIGWYMKQDNALDPKSNVFKEYAYGLAKWEKDLVRKVKAYYGYDLTMEQMAWWRMKLYENYHGNETACLQELPFTEDEAFQLSGSKFFASSDLISQYKIAKEKEKEALPLRITYDGKFHISKTEANPNLLIYEPPDPNGVYVVGADPTMGASLESDNACICVLRCYKEKVVQVAEFSDNSITPQEFARFVLFIAGLYSAVMTNLEVNGIGRLVLNEIDTLRKTGWVPEVIGNQEFKYNLRKIKDYLYFRPDTLRRSYVRHWATTPETKAHMFNLIKGYLKLRQIELSSIQLIKEMERIVKDGTVIEAQAGFHDDRVIALGLALEAYDRWIKHKAPNIEEGEIAKTPEELKIGNLRIKLR
jgi:hypothetical protein